MEFHGFYALKVALSCVLFLGGAVGGIVLLKILGELAFPDDPDRQEIFVILVAFVFTVAGAGTLAGLKGPDDEDDRACCESSCSCAVVEAATGR